MSFGRRPAEVDYAGAYGQVTRVGTSRGTQRATRGVANSTRPDRPVLNSGFLSYSSGDNDTAFNTIGSPDRLPPTLIVRHRHDGCRLARPEGAGPFVGWGALLGVERLGATAFPLGAQSRRSDDKNP